jgi:hypothetical protein
LGRLFGSGNLALRFCGSGRGSKPIATIALVGAVVLAGCDTTLRAWRAEEAAIAFDGGRIEVRRESSVWRDDYLGEMSHALIWFAFNNDRQARGQTSISVSDS